jgi:hypothetical protein
MKKIVFISFLICLLFFIYNFYNPSIVLKWLMGSARCIGEPQKVNVLVNGTKNNEIKVFHIDEGFNNKEKEDYFVFYVRNIKGFDEPVYIVDKFFFL